MRCRVLQRVVFELTKSNLFCCPIKESIFKIDSKFVFYPLFHNIRPVKIELEIVDYIGIKNGIPLYRCCRRGKKWVNLLYEEAMIDQITANDTLECNYIEEYLNSSFCNEDIYSTKY